MITKKGSLSDAIYAPIYILGIGMVMVLAFYMWFQISGNFANMSGIPASVNQSVTTTINAISPVYSLFDYMIPFIVGALLMVSLIFAFKRGASITYAGLAIIFWILAMLLSQIYIYVFDNFSAQFPTITSYFPMLIWIMANMDWVVLAWLFLISTVMFTRNKREDNQIMQSEQVFSGGMYG